MTWSWELFGAMTFVACVVYGLVVPRAFHASQLLEQWTMRRGVRAHHWRFGDMPRLRRRL